MFSPRDGVEPVTAAASPAVAEAAAKALPVQEEATTLAAVDGAENK